jgi:hypothetical protein
VLACWLSASGGVRLVLSLEGDVVRPLRVVERDEAELCPIVEPHPHRAGTDHHDFPHVPAAVVVDEALLELGWLCQFLGFAARHRVCPCRQGSALIALKDDYPVAVLRLAACPLRPPALSWMVTRSVLEI